jgi:hypothetical protein
MLSCLEMTYNGKTIGTAYLVAPGGSAYRLNWYFDSGWIFRNTYQGGVRGAQARSAS